LSAELDRLNELEERVRKTEAVQAITNIQALYSFHIDAAKIDDLLDLFADEFEWNVGFKGDMTTWTSKEELSQFLKKSCEATPMMRHQPITPYIEVNGDKATGAFYLTGMITSITTDGKQARWVQGRYDNEYVCVDGKWKISRLQFVHNFLTPYEDGWVKTPVAKFFPE
jgi:hypothetical protein